MNKTRFHKLTGLALAVALAGGALAPAAMAQEAAPAPVAAEAPVAAAPEAAAAVAAPAEAAPAEAAPAAEAAAPTVDKGDTTWMLVSTVLVLLMIIPGLALFYGGLVRQKNMLSMLMQVSTVTVIGMIAWLFYGYSLAFTDGGALDSFVGGAGRLFLKDVTPASVVATFSTGIAIPELVFICFQMTFACITASLVLGGVAERMKFAAVVAFAILWPLLSYYPMAHMVWWWAGPDAVAAAPGDPIQSGLLWGFGALDFAGGTVVHINAGIAALVGALIVGPRKGYGQEAMPPHSLTLTLTGAGLLWVGWFGFNAGSNLEANGYAALAMINTLVATAAAGISWVAVEWLTRGKASMLGLASGLVAGLVAVTPAAGFAGPVGAVVLGLIVSPICVFFCSTIKNALKYDDSLDAFGIHAVGGIVGAIATGLLVNPAWGGAGVVDYTTCALDGDISTCDTAAYVMGTQVLAQIKAVLVAIAWSGVMSSIVFFVIKYTIGLRPSVETEEEGLDITEHGERAYHS
ncbi:ammonia channel protein [Phenylobacterium sp. Root77]|jgi:Amt family ammonium transporter|uniref:ammonium transporter n=1 Tax=unclassified Phenylobacterium TaxID=2640670 RepID=UPI0006F85E48|nr:MULTISPECIES: ammonium transporter [unclassified Phenylobacterium]KQW71937.1 ammonia channel protein [Phenylobacterium sp. Root1277]KQW94858.1 ammonia channel protein [Phenylobacterium sp. Root1290]KRC44552.1 ammonia channel protein [Phenylobacterium sp. Root77]